MAMYRICQNCGAYLDSGELGDCRMESATKENVDGED